MNAGGVLNTCKSNVRGAIPESGGRVSNTWVTCLEVGDNHGKPWLIPHGPKDMGMFLGKALVLREGPASD
jgi:hypothetical protein